ncbi:ribulose-phosphate 3-epimerase [Candidatus Eisenbacteria bacterium]|uniref:Ribulose-phosphate 3-epimerase n=1 Tax=Eiseniibacteriota bacterium TaxID=2212470 RepID=A0ABV6YJD4_UNCEI
MKRTPKQIPTGFQIAPSLLAADFARVADEIGQVEAAGIEMLHLDVMDGHFVPNITLGPPLVRSIRGATDLFLDTHLMISHPFDYIEPFAKAGADLLTLHVEALGHGEEAGIDVAVGRVKNAAEKLRELGCLIGLTFRPGTDPMVWLPRLGPLVDLVLVMTVEPGFGGQAFMSEMLPRITAVRRLADERGWRYRVEADGGIDRDTAQACVQAGAEILVAGTAIFSQDDRARAILEIRQVASEGRASL